jgi:serine/threonine protein phosphatase 1
MFRLFSSRPKLSRRLAEIPQGLRVYAIGDIHGRLDLLLGLHEKLVEDARSCSDLEQRIIYLGDYIDRGPSSKEVLETVRTVRPGGLPVTPLLGNHEAMMLRFLEDCSAGPEWFTYGGLATLMSYGVNPKGGGSAEEKLESVQRALAEKLPAVQREFLMGLPTHTAVGDYFFAHAGVRPGIRLDQQKDSDLIWIRDEFLRSNEFHGKVVVHGHSYKTEPEVMSNRIGIDTGAYATGRLTCLVLEGTGCRFL